MKLRSTFFESLHFISPSFLKQSFLIVSLSFAVTTPDLALGIGGPPENGTPDEIVSYIDAVVKDKKNNKTLTTFLVENLNNPDGNIRVRERAAWALGELGARNATPHLIGAAKHKGLLIRSAALGALARFRARSPLSTYAEIANNDPILSLRQRATITLGLLRWEKTIPHLVALSTDEAPEIRGAAALAMAAIHSKKNDFSEALKEMAAEEDPYVKERAQRALEVVMNKKTVIRGHLKSEDADIRLFAALYFHYHGNASDLKAIKEASNREGNDEVRYEINRALLGIKRREEAAEKARKEREAREAAKKEAEKSKDNLNQVK